MKKTLEKYFEKYDLVKLVGIFILIAVLLTWIVPYSYFDGSEMVIESITRVGFSDFMQYGLLGMYYFTVLVTFLFVLGGFYQVLSKTAGYQTLIKKICRALDGKEIAFSLIVSFIIALLCSMTSEYFPLLVLIPFIITILNRLRVDKISAFCTTFGGLLIGTIGSTCSDKVASLLVESFGLESGSYAGLKIIILIVTYVLLMIFTVIRMIKVRSEKQKFVEYDKFDIETVKESTGTSSCVPYIIGGILLLAVVALAYLPWSSWEITLFDDITEWVNDLSLFGFPIVSSICSTFIAFGEWDIFTIQFVLLFAVLLLHWCGKVTWDDVFKSFADGFKKISYVVVILILVYTVLIFAVMFPVVPYIIDLIAGIADGFNGILTFISAFIASIFGVEMTYVISLGGTYFATLYSEYAEAISIIFQTAFGFASFFVPTSAILMMGLAYLDIPYKDWMKFIWKFLIALLIFIVIILLIVCA